MRGMAEALTVHPQGWQESAQVSFPRQAEEVRRFAFVIHPLDVGYIHRHPAYRWTRVLPDGLVETASAWMPPRFVSRIVGARSPATGQRVEGLLISLGATPRQMLRRSAEFTYRRLVEAARLAERWGAGIMGLGAFTSVVGDAGLTVAREAEIGITSGNSLTVAATLEVARVALARMGVEDLGRARAMVIGATGSIGSICSRLLARQVAEVVLVSIEPERLVELERTIRGETPGARVRTSLSADGLVGDCDVVVTATSAFGQRVLDVSQARPGAVICDVARPPDLGAAEAALRPDVLVVESGEVLIPGDVDFGYDIGLPPKTAYACLAETALLAMEGRFGDYTLGRSIEMERVEEIYGLFRKHGFRIAGLRSFGRYLGDEEVAAKRRLAEELRRDAALLAHARAESAGRLAAIPVAAKGVRANGGLAAKDLAWLAGSAAVLGLVAARRRRLRRQRRRVA
jgi:predicted amino acid dehydrogenase